MDEIMFYPSDGASPVTAEQIAQNLSSRGLNSWVQQETPEAAPWVMIANGDAALKLSVENGQATAGALECPPGELDLIDRVAETMAEFGWTVDETA